MPIATREAGIVWEEALASGNGTLSSGSGALEQLPVTWASRTERTDGKTSPEELIAAPVFRTGADGRELPRAARRSLIRSESSRFSCSLVNG